MSGVPGEDYPVEQNIGTAIDRDAARIRVQFGQSEPAFLTPAQARQLADAYEQVDIDGPEYSLEELIDDLRSKADRVASMREDLSVPTEGETFDEEVIDHLTAEIGSRE